MILKQKIPPPLKEEGVRGWRNRSARSDRTKTETRRKLRNESTLAEQTLWMSLKGSQLDGRKFTRQKGIGRYVVDFYCPEERLAIELDGDIHDIAEIKEYDQMRQAELCAAGVTVLRFTNERIFAEIFNVLAEIGSVWKGRERKPILAHNARPRYSRAPKHSDIAE